MQLEAPPVTKFKKPSWRTVANLYREGLTHVFGGDPENPDEYLVKALKKDVHRASEAPGQWSPHSLLEIYCESGIPNATDINDFSRYASEMGCDPSATTRTNGRRLTSMLTRRWLSRVTTTESITNHTTLQLSTLGGVTDEH